MANINSKNLNPEGSGFMDLGNILLVIAVVAVVVSIFTFIRVINLNQDVQLAPAVGEEGTAQIEIIQNARIDTTYDIINFSAGFVNPGSGPLTLTSNDTGPYTNWLDSGSTPITLDGRGFIIENIGNVDLDLEVELEDAMDTWLPPGPSTTSAILDYMLNDCDTTAPVIPGIDCSFASQVDPVSDGDVACVTFSLGTTVNTFKTIPVGSLDQTCDNFTFNNNRDEVRLDLRLTLPEDIAPTSSPVSNRVIIDIDAA